MATLAVQHRTPGAIFKGTGGQLKLVIGPLSPSPHSPIMPSYRIERHTHTNDTATSPWAARSDRKESSTRWYGISDPRRSVHSHVAEQRSVRGSSLPRIEVIEDEMDASVDDGQVSSGYSRSSYPDLTCSAICSSFEYEDSPESSDDCDSEDETSSAPSIRR